MKHSELLSYLSSLSESEKEFVFKELSAKKENSLDLSYTKEREVILNNKQGFCGHCGGAKYVKFGIDKGVQRYKCKSCKRSFTEHTGTWMAGLHSKEKINDYLVLMYQEKSLDKIKISLHMNKKTVFDWRHKILSSIANSEEANFTGITESDETFFLKSDKGKHTKGKTSRKRGGLRNKRGITKDYVAVLTTQDRGCNVDLQIATLGRISQDDISRKIGDRISERTILCSDGHRSYKAFAKENKLEHHVLKGKRVISKVFHIQNINSLHNRLKKWIESTFWGVSTKYLQQYLNWFRMKEQLKNTLNPEKEFFTKINTCIKAVQRYQNIENQYQTLIT